MEREKIMAKAREAGRGKFLYECPKYKIKRVPLNYKIYFKLKLKPEFISFGNTFHTPVEHGIDYAIEDAEGKIKEYFTSEFNPNLE